VTRLTILVLAATACGGNKAEPTTAGSGSAPAGSAAAPAGSAVAGSSVAGSAVAGSAASGTGSAGSAAAPPLSPKIAAARCDEPCLFLVDTPIAQLADAFKSACNGAKSTDLGFEDCKRLDYTRTCIYAAHGLVYKKGRWKTAFAGKPWYDPNPAIDAKTVLSTLERANVHELYERGKACRKNLNISGADYDRIKAWFGALPKQPPLPAVVFMDSNPVKAKPFMDALQHGEDSGINDGVGSGKVVLGGKVTAMYLTGDLHETGADYPSDDMPAAMVTAVHAKDETTLRLVRVRFPNPTLDNSGTDVFLVYDDKDVLRGVEVRPFGYESGDPQ
jgi:hypothetical protein